MVIHGVGSRDEVVGGGEDVCKEGGMKKTWGG